MHKYAFFMHVARTQASRLHSNTLPPACHIQIDYPSLNRLILRIFVQNSVSGQMSRIKGSHTRIYAPKKRTEYHILEHLEAKNVNSFKLLPRAKSAPLKVIAAQADPRRQTPKVTSTTQTIFPEALSSLPACSYYPEQTVRGALFCQVPSGTRRSASFFHKTA